MTIFAVDIGNSRFKWFDGERYRSFSYNEQEFESLLHEHWSDYEKPQHILVSDVSSVGTIFSNWCKQNWHSEVEIITSKKNIGKLEFAYDDSAQLGVDRQLAMFAAWNRIQSDVCVIDAGTALTLDFVTRDGNHLGGYIVPGYELMLYGLTQGTRALRANTSRIDSLKPGVNTEQCINRGCLAMLTDFCKSRIDEFNAENDLATVNILTGGNAEQLKAWFVHDCSVVPELVLEGIMLWHQQR